MIVKIDKHLIDTKWVYSISHIDNNIHNLYFSILFIHTDKPIYISRKLDNYNESVYKESFEKANKELQPLREALIKIWLENQSSIIDINKLI